ncbi:hypothetical protein C1H46_043286 [Malus baccata]|uniref:Uncharacterized protein n=1 Tax=Malus baccata TaxID=106549 RepID=A0A540KAC5_MALBA|nr:hypothetical protein C1H46_043286 [Malus baccata]
MNHCFDVNVLWLFNVLIEWGSEKCRQLVGEESTSQSGKFTFLNCFDMSSGTLACSVKEGVKLYVNNIRASHVETMRHKAIESALADALSQGISAKDAAKQAQKAGAKAAKLATRQAKRIIGPIISSGWDFSEAMYYGAAITEGSVRGTGTMFGTYAGGFLGEQRLGRFGYLVGSQLGSWVGGRIGLMVYDVINAANYILQFAEKCRQLVGEESTSQSGKFTFLNCFDMSSGTLACSVKEGVKLYVNNIRASHVETMRHKAIESALADALSQGISAKDAAKQAQKAGAKAAKLATRQAKRIIGPIISSGWDFSEAMYYGAAITEGSVRGTGTMFGTYAGGFLGEQRLGRFGYLVGSQLGSWVGGRIGLMVYDVINAANYILQFGIPE